MLKMMFGLLRATLVLLTGRGYDRSRRLNNLHHKLSYRLHKSLPLFGIRGVQKIAVPAHPDKHMYVHAEDGGVAHQLIMYRQYEPFETSLIQSHIEPGMTVYNIGANLGYYVVVTSIAASDKGCVVAFEPEPGNFQLLERTVSENRLANVELHQCAVGATQGNATLALSATNSGDHQLHEASDRDSVTVEVVTVDTMISEGASAPDVIILDVQGSELDVLRGMSTLLAARRPLVIFTELWPKGLDARNPNGARAFLQLLTDSGFSIGVIEEKEKRVTTLPIPNLLASINDNEERNLVCVRY